MKGDWLKIIGELIFVCSLGVGICAFYSEVPVHSPIGHWVIGCLFGGALFVASELRRTEDAK